MGKLFKIIDDRDVIEKKLRSGTPIPSMLLNPKM